MKQISVMTDTQALYDLLVEKLEDITENKDEQNGFIKVYDSDFEVLTDAIAETVTEHYGEKMLFKIVNHNYFYLDAYEKKEILKKALSIRDKKSKELIKKSLAEYLKTTDCILIDGFVNFRLCNYIKRLERLVDISADEYMVEKEYEEFISLLKTFASMQPPCYKKMHIVAKTDRYILYDEYENDITEECMEEFVLSASDEKMNKDDLLISILISKSPEKICIHNVKKIKNKELLSTIKKVFEGNVTEFEPDMVF